MATDLGAASCRTFREEIFAEDMDVTGEGFRFVK